MDVPLALDSKLTNVQKAITAVKQNDRATACNELGAFYQRGVGAKRQGIDTSGGESDDPGCRANQGRIELSVAFLHGDLADRLPSNFRQNENGRVQITLPSPPGFLLFVNSTRLSGVRNISVPVQA
jgi:hypothetical protein